tara:strand:+ start:272 stop:472 length:201 start_codon:yes stop_codon:yes gene_type:complete
MAEKIMRKVKKLTTFFSATIFFSISAFTGCLKIKYLNASPKLIQVSNINITTSHAINVFIGLLHEN